MLHDSKISKMLEGGLMKKEEDFFAMIEQVLKQFSISATDHLSFGRTIAIYDPADHAPQYRSCQSPKLIQFLV